MMYPDQHVHTDFSGDSDTPPEEQLEKAAALGMRSICFTDHHDHDVCSDVDFNLDIPRYFEKMSALKEAYKDKIEIRIGIELGLQLHIADYLENIAKEYPFDFIIGSMHFIDGLDPYYDEYFDINGKNAYRRYFEVTLKRLETIKNYDSLGHLDYVVRYGKRHGLTYSYSEYADHIDPILNRIIADGKALECNTGGFSRGMSEPNPCRDVLRRYRELGGELVTIGSDAHSPDTLGYAFDECGQLLKECGFEYYAVYKERKPVMHRL